jgi:hypothetical protein
MIYIQTRYCWNEKHDENIETKQKQKQYQNDKIVNKD